MDIFAETGTKEKKQGKKELIQLLEEKDKQINDYINDLKRLQAEFENYIKRNEKEKEEFSKYASYKLGIKLLHKNFHKVLEEENIKEIKSVGERINPFYHEVIQKVKSDKDDGIILEEIQKGYLLYDKVLRHAKVVSSENIKNQNLEEENE